MRIELTNGKSVEFDEIASRARVHANFKELEDLLERVMAVALVAQAESDKDVKDSYFSLSTPRHEFLGIANAAAQHLRNIKYWYDDYPLDGSNPWG